jgi:membrane protein implicated in regulation of membrane protease activity
MEISWWLWLIAALVLFMLEIATSGFVVMWFGVGALTACVLDLMGIHDVYIQVIVFAIVSLVLVTLTRTIFKNIFMRASPGSKIKTNTDVMIGKTGVVTQQIDNDLSQGRILVEGQDWSARSVDNSIISADAKARIIRIEGIKLIVERV